MSFGGPEYRRCSRDERQWARQAVYADSLTVRDHVNRAGLGWVSHTSAACVGILVALVGFATVLAARGDVQRLVPALLSSVTVLAMVARHLVHHWRFRRLMTAAGAP